MGFIGFQLFEVMSLLIFAVVIGIFISVLVKNISRNRKDNNSPRLTVEAKVLAKRHDVSRHHSAGEHHHHHYHNSYFVTFEVPSGDRIELQLQGHEYGLLIEGDRGKLTFQGTRYLGFERT